VGLPTTRPTLQPKISFVVAARNDNYGGDFLHRMQVFVNCLFALWRRYDLNGELIIVEWNPPEGAPRLAQALSWPPWTPPDRVRIIEVPAALHRRLPNSDRIAVFEYIAKNVGVRRANGQYVLATNADIVFSQELIKFLASENLSPHCFYRIDRYDVGAPVPLDRPVDEQLRFCAERSVCVHSRIGNIPLRPLARRSFNIYRGYLKKLWPKEAIRWFMTKFVFKIHTGAPGDFTLMAKTSWHALRGYPELASQRHVDSYLCSMAKSSGLSQVVLKRPLRIYHQDHDCTEMARRPATDYELYWRDTRAMLEFQKPVILNDETWGLGGQELPETTIS